MVDSPSSDKNNNNKEADTVTAGMQQLSVTDNSPKGAAGTSEAAAVAAPKAADTFVLENPAYDDSAQEFGVEEAQAIVDGTEINFVKVGTGKTNILCIPGTLGTWVDFAPLFGVFDLTKYTLLALDLPGYGKSIPPERKYNMQTNMNDAKLAHQLMKDQGLLPFACLGWSEGMRAATLLCATFPKSVTKCIVWGGVAYITQHISKFFQVMKDVDQWPDKDSVQSFEKIYGKTYFRKIWASQADFYINVHHAVPNGNLIFDMLHKVQTPYLLIHCGKDTMLGDGRVQSDKIVQKVKRGRLIENATAGHAMHLQQPEWFVKVATEFINESVAPPPGRAPANQNAAAASGSGSQAVAPVAGANVPPSYDSTSNNLP